MGPDIARRMWRVLEPYHAVTYFSDESRQAFKDAGLRGFWMGYFAGRAAPMGPVGPGGPIDQNWRGEHRLPLLRLNRRVIRYDLGELMAWRQKQGRFFDIATLLSSTNAIGFSEIVGLIRISIGLDVLLPAKLLTQSRFD